MLMYSATIFWLCGLGELPYHPFGTMMPSALPIPTALVKAEPWSGPAAAMKIFGV